MIIINKKYSNLLQGYKRVLELETELKLKWKETLRPEIHSLLTHLEEQANEEYLVNYSEWQKREEVDRNIWEESEKNKHLQWMQKELGNELKVVNDNAEIKDRNDSANRTTKILRIVSLCLFCFGVCGIVFFQNTYIPFPNTLTILFVNILLLLLCYLTPI